MLNTLILSAFVCGLVGARQPTVNINFIVNSQFKGIDALIQQAGKNVVPLVDSISYDGVEAKDVSIGEITTIARRGTAIQYIPEDNVIEVDAGFGLNNMTLIVTEVTAEGETFPATITVGENKFTFHQKVVYSEESCVMTFSNLAMVTIEKVTLQSANKKFDGRDVTEFFKQQVVPKLNQYLSSPEFMKKVDYYFDSCQDNGSHLRDLIFS